jgi:hypothetical protein
MLHILGLFETRALRAVTGLKERNCTSYTVCTLHNTSTGSKIGETLVCTGTTRNL